MKKKIDPKLKKLIGKTVEEVKTNMPKGYSRIRVIQEDGKHLIVTMDLRSDRINVHTQDDIIIKIHGVY